MVRGARHLQIQDIHEEETPWTLLLSVTCSILFISFILASYWYVQQFHHLIPNNGNYNKDSATSRTMAGDSYEPISQHQMEPHQEEDTTTTCTKNLQSIGTDDTGDDSNSSVSIVQRVHVIILVHGWLGCPQDLAYIHHSLQREADHVMQQEENERNGLSSHTKFVIHTCNANENRTNDGVQTGANRIAVEVQGVLDSVQAEYSEVKEITFSMFGFSLGGLYSRVALPDIVERWNTSQKANSNDDGKNTIKLIPKLFCTMATPHLGCRNHTYFPFPGFVDKILSRLIPTERDLFLHTPLIQKTITDPRWTEPLLQFEKRIAYANTFGMDMMVPTNTAVFLSKHIPGAEHYFVCDDAGDGYAALVVETKRVESHDDSCATADADVDDSSNNEDAHHDRHRSIVVATTCGGGSDDETEDISTVMAQRLDNMGWTKVFVDYTDSFHPSSSSSSSSSPSSEANNNNINISSSNRSSQHKDSYRSSELAAMFHPRNRRGGFHLFPNHHDLMPVNSKNAYLSYANRKGRPLIDQMATDFIHDVVNGPSINFQRHNN